MSNCLKYLKGGQTEKTERETEILKWGGGRGKLGQGLGALKRGAKTPSRTMLHVNRLHKLYVLLYVVHASYFSSL